MTDEDLRAQINALMKVRPEEAELVAWYDAHRDLFGGRPFERSRRAVDRLVRIERTRTALAERGIQ